MFLRPKVAVGILLLTVLFSCSGPQVNPSFSEGEIVYDVTFPYNQDDILVNLFPQEMILKFSDNRIHATMQSLGGIITNDFIADNNTLEFDQMLKSFKERFTLHLDEKGVDHMLSTMPKMTLVKTNRVDTLAGFECKITLAEFEGDSVPPIELWHTGEIDVQNANWWNQFNECGEMLLGYEVEQYGMRMKLRAKSVRMEEVDESVFDVPTEYTVVNYDQMTAQIQGLLDQFNRE